MTTDIAAEIAATDYDIREFEGFRRIQVNTADPLATPESIGAWADRLSERLGLHLDCPGNPLYQWAPADDPAEVVGDLVAMIEDLREEMALIKDQKVPPVICYWDREGRETGYGEISEITDEYDYGTVVGVEHVAVVKTTFHVLLEPAADADSDDEWEFDGSSRAEAEAALAAELARRKRLATPEGC